MHIRYILDKVEPMLSTTNPAIDDGVNLQTIGCVVCKIATEKRCSGCNIVRYCCDEHQRQHWGLHKLMCKEGTSLICILSDVKSSRDIRPDNAPMQNGLYSHNRLCVQVKNLVETQFPGEITDSNIDKYANSSVLVALLYSSCVIDHPQFGNIRKSLAQFALMMCSQLNKSVQDSVGYQHNRFLLSEERVYLMLYGYDIDFTKMVMVYNKWSN